MTNWLWKAAIAGFCGSVAHTLLMYLKSRYGLLPAFQPYESLQAALSRITARKETDVFVIKSGPTSLYFKVRGEAADPLTGDEATRIAQVLVRNETTQAELQRKAQAADVAVTYFGDYEKIMAAAKPNQPATNQPATNQPATSQPAPNQPAPK